MAGPVTTLGVDLSNHQAEPNWPLLARTVGFVVLKATEGVGFVDRTWARRRAAAHAAGIPAVGGYHFARLGDPAAEARAFLTALGPLAPTEFTALDLEVAVAGVDPVAWSAAWLDIVHAATGRWPLLYLNGSELAGLNWAPVTARGVRLWLARYDGSQAPTGAGQFPALTVKQFTDAGTVPGVAGPVDTDVLYGTPSDLTQGSTDMPLNAVDLDAIWNYPINGVRARDRIEGVDRLQLPAIAAAVGEIHGKVVTEQYDLTGRPQDRPDDLLGHVLSADARARDTKAAVDALAGKVGQPAPVTVDAPAFLAALQADPAALAAIAQAMAPTVAAAVITQIGAHLNTPPAQ